MIVIMVVMVQLVILGEWLAMMVVLILREVGNDI